MKETLKELTHEFDHNYGALNLRLHTLNNINAELSFISEKVFNTNKTDLTAMGMTLHDIDHKIELLEDLLRYTLEDLNDEMEKTRIIKESYFDLLVRNANEKESPSHEYPYFDSLEKMGEHLKEQEKEKENTLESAKKQG